MTTPVPPSPAQWHCAPCARTLLERERPTHTASSAHRKRQSAHDASATVQRALQAAIAAARPSSVSPPSPTPGLWECTVCKRSMKTVSMTSHLGGAPHLRNLALAEQQEKQEEENTKEEEKKKAEEEKKEEGKKKEEEEKKEEIWMCALCCRGMKAGSKSSHLAGAPHLRNQALADARLAGEPEPQEPQPEVEEEEEEEDVRWECTLCNRSMRLKSMASHLGGAPHIKNQRLSDARAAAPEQEEDDGLWECTVCARSMKAISMASHLGGAPHARNVLLRQEQLTDELVEADEDAMWECRVCARSMKAVSMKSHLRGAPHLKAQLQVFAPLVVVVREEPEVDENDEKRRVLEAHRRNWEATREELRRAEVRRIDDERRMDEEEAVRVAEEEKRAEEEVKWMEMERDLMRAQEVLAEQKRVEEERKKIEEERVQEEQAEQQAEEAQKDLIQTPAIEDGEQTTEIEDPDQPTVEQRDEDSTQTADAQLTDADQPAKAKKQRKPILTDEEKQRKKQVEDDLRKVQEDLIRKMETDDAERTKEEESEADRTRFMENAAAADEQLRLAQERLRREWVSKLQTAAAAAAEAEARRKLEAQRAEEQAARLLADQEQIENENRRRDAEEYEQQQAERLAIAQQQRVFTPEGPLASPVSSIGTMGFFQQAGPSTQTTYEAAGIMDPASEAAILRYLQWQSIIQEMQQQEVWLEQPLVLYRSPYPAPRLSLTLAGHSRPWRPSQISRQSCTASTTRPPSASTPRTASRPPRRPCRKTRSTSAAWSTCTATGAAARSRRSSRSRRHRTAQRARSRSARPAAASRTSWSR